MRRRVTIILHWLSFLLLVLLIAGGTQPALAWAFGLSGLGLCLLALVFGLMNGPGAKLSGTMRRAHPWFSRAMYVALGIVAGLTLLDQMTGEHSPQIIRYHFYLLAASSLHAIFHLWRHTTLGDGALRRITPSAMHGLL